MTAHTIADALRCLLSVIEETAAYNDPGGFQDRVTEHAEGARAALAAHNNLPERYRVEWAIDSDAATPELAARQAWAALRRRGSIANVFIVRDAAGNDTLIDLEPNA